MCGIGGFVLGSHEDPTKLTNIFRDIEESLQKRGPDFSGRFFDPKHCVGLSHTRLSIIDRSTASNQPLISPDLRYSLIFNGEIYNYKELASDYLGPGTQIRATSDSHVLLALIIKIGIYRTLEVIDGMFAFAVYDSLDKKIYLARDRFGQKPLYIMKPSKGYGFRFASTISAVCSTLKNRPTLNIDCISGFLARGYIAEPETIYQGIESLPGGNIAVFNIDNARLTIKRYINASINKTLSKEQSFNIKARENELREALISSVDKTLRADEQPALCLSGGIDSTLIAAVAKIELGKTLDTYTLKLNDYSDETGAASHTASSLGHNNKTIIFNNDKAYNVFNDYVAAIDQPHADEASMGLLVLNNAIAQHHRVFLTGDGGDEMLYGYRRHIAANTVDTLLLGHWLKNSSWTNCSSRQHNFTPNISSSLSNIMKPVWPILNKSSARLYDCLFSKSLEVQWSGLSKSPSILPTNSLRKGFASNVQWLDVNHYLPGCLLFKSDRVSMFNSIESRAPFLSNDIVNISQKYSASECINGNFGKIPLRNILESYHLPLSAERKKTGFTVNLGYLSHDAFRNEIIQLSSSCYLEDVGIDLDVVHRLVGRLEQNKRKSSLILFRLLVLNAWLRSEDEK